MKALIGFLLLALHVPATAQYAVVADENPGGEVIGACGKPLPAKQARNVRGTTLLCGGAIVNLPMRSAVRSEKWDDWSRLERSDSAGTLETRQEMQNLRLTEAPFAWSGQAKYKTYETWNYSIRMRGRNPGVCRTWQRAYTCTKTRQEAIRERRCHYVPDAPVVVPAPSAPAPSRQSPSYGNSPSSSPSPSRSRDPWDTPTPRRNDGPSTGSRMDPGSRYDSYKPNYGSGSGSYSSPKPSYSGGSSRSSGSSSRPSGSSGSSGGSRSSSGSNRRSSLDGFFISRAYAAESCADEIVGYRSISYNDTCYEQMVDECEWEEQRSAQRECGEQTMNYSVEFSKPTDYDKAWRPGQKGYHDLLPNKYDLLPGEWEKYTLITNRGLSDSMGVGKSARIQPSFEIENAWNKYRVEFTPAVIECRLSSEVNLKGRILTDSRLIRKAPNALARPTDRLGKDRSLDRGEYFGQDGKVSKLRPTRIRMVDISNETMMVASRQSRKFVNTDPDAVETTYAGAKQKIATAAELGFMKNTLLKVKLIEKNTCFGEGEKKFADVLDTTSRLTKGEENSLLVPLDGTEPGVDSFYRPYGFVGKILGVLPGGPVDLFLNPGMNYEFRVSMLQQGLPFYENGCKNGAATCEKEDANPLMYSEELVIDFTADPSYDERGLLQRFENWYSKKAWNKFRTCGGDQ